MLRYLLFPFAIIYDAVTTIRNFFFNVGIFKETTFKIPIIVVGNLSFGGTGKTPQIEYLIRLLKDRFKVAVLSRGYKRKTNDYVLINGPIIYRVYAKNKSENGQSNRSQLSLNCTKYEKMVPIAFKLYKM